MTTSLWWSTILCILAAYGQVESLSPDYNQDQDSTVRTKRNARQRIMGGTVAQPNKYPFIGSVMWKSYTTLKLVSEHHCHCALILANEANIGWTNMAIGVASCFIDHYGIKATKVQVVLGAHDLSKKEDGRMVVNGVVHRIEAIDLAGEKDLLRPEQIGTVIGWGATDNPKQLNPVLHFVDNFMSKNSPVLHQVELPIETDEFCMKQYRSSPRYIAGEMFCAGQENKGICAGDIGSPFVKEVNPGKYILYGLASFFGGNCGHPRLIGIFTKVGNHRRWIQDKIEKLNGPTIPMEEVKLRIHEQHLLP